MLHFWLHEVSDRTPLARHCPSPSASSLKSRALPLVFRAALWRQHHRKSDGRLPRVLQQNIKSTTKTDVLLVHSNDPNALDLSFEIADAERIDEAICPIQLVRDQGAQLMLAELALDGTAQRHVARVILSGRREWAQIASTVPRQVCRRWFVAC